MSENCYQDEGSHNYDEYSQPLFSEENKAASPTAQHLALNESIDGFDEENMSQSILQPPNNNKRKDAHMKIETKEDAHNDVQERNNNSDNHVNDSDNNCIHCTFERELDKRNYYFGNLLIGELQFLPPCMRSEAYINILKYVRMLKHKHVEQE